MNVLRFFIDENDNFRIGNIIITFLVLTLLCGPLSYYGATAMGWIQLPAKKLNVQNVEDSYTWFYTQRETVRQDAANVELTNQQMNSFMVANGSDSSKWTQAAKLQYTQLMSIQEQQAFVYNNACATYQARWDNVFKTAFLQAPTDIPRDCPLIGGK